MPDAPLDSSRCCDEYDAYRRNRSAGRHTRRDFLRTTVGALAAAPLLPHMMLNSALAQRAMGSSATESILVVIQLAGGNDGLNSVVPYGSDLYYRARPNIAVPSKSVLPLDGTMGFNPNLKGLKSLYDAGKVAVVQGVGYDNPSRSHFQGTSIWETADTSGTSTTGWLGRFLDAELAGSNNPLAAIALGPLLPQTLISTRAPVTTIENISSFRFELSAERRNPIMAAYNRMYAPSAQRTPDYLGLIQAAGADAWQGVSDLAAVATNYKPSVQYPTNPLGQELQLVSQIIAANLGTRIFHLTLGGFDDHAAEVYTHATLMKDLGDSLSTFYADLSAHGKADGVVTKTFSEFGRRVHENAGRGTDHGTAAPVFVVGGKVKGGLYGADPILSSLDTNGDLKYDIDFRSVYGTLLDGWLGASSTGILGGSYERLPFL